MHATAKLCLGSRTGDTASSNAPPWIASSGCRGEVRGRGESNQENSRHRRRSWSEGTQLYHEGPMSAGIYFSDPDGMQIELYAPKNPRKSSEQELNLRPSAPD